MTTRRKVLKAGIAGTAIAAAYPIGAHLLWSAKNFEAPDGVLPLDEANGKEISWRNWSGLQRANPASIASPGNEEDLATLIASAPGPVRPVGSGHSFTALVPTSGTIIDIGQFSGLVDYDLESQTIVVGAGTRLGQLARQLDEIGLAMPNLPDVDLQTLAGSFATATHGTGLELTALHDMVTGFRLVTASGDIVDVDAKNNPALFAAGKVSLGSLGVITQYHLQVRGAYTLRRRTIAMHIQDLLAEAESLAANHRNFEFLFLPHTGFAGALSHDITDETPERRPPSEDEEILGSLRDLRDMVGWSPRIRRWLASTQFEPGVIEDITDKSWRLLANKRVAKFNESEYHIPHENGLAAVRAAIDVLERRNDTYYPMEVRFVRGDDAWLSPFKNDQNISIAVHAANTEDYRYLVDELGPVFRRFGGRPHWGKLHGLTARDLTSMYPHLQDFSDLRRQMDPQGKFLNAHLSDIFGASDHG